jgi:hypothetical protein
MIKDLALTISLIAVFLISGCAGLVSAPGTTEQELVERDGIDVALIPAAYREVYFSPSTSNERHCRAPDPDFSVQQSDKLSVSLPTNGGESMGGGETQTGLNLGGRTQTVLITRELMYRACELAANINADADTSIAIYDKFLQAIQALADKPFADSKDSAQD